ncbi:MAG TPA: hypothetical protein GX702_08030 [Chloroflexi bacterium]|jgi:uncharacterized protein YaaQ|nr:hypothetical protein [Chloroflexota bacterium]
MKLVLAIVRDDFAADVTFALNNEGLSVTRISATGGFWRRGYVTLLIGVQENRLERALEIVDAHAGPNEQASEEQGAHPPHRATVFVLNVDSFARY